MEFGEKSTLALAQLPQSVKLGEKWYTVAFAEEIFEIFDMIADGQTYMLVAGCTAHGKYCNGSPGS